MQKLFIIFFLLITVSAEGYSQQTIENLSLSQPDLQLLYSGRENKIKITLPDTAKTYTLTSSACTIHKNTDTTFVIYPPYNIGIDTIRVIEGEKVIQEFIFRILNMPINTVQIANLTPIQKKAAKTEILSYPRIELIRNSLYISDENIVSYDFRIFSPTAPDSLIFEKTESQGTAFTPAQINAIQNAKPGDRIEISRIIVVNTEGINYVYRGLYVILE